MWRPEPVARHAADPNAQRPGDGSRGLVRRPPSSMPSWPSGVGQRTGSGSRSQPVHGAAARQQPPPALARPLAGSAPLTAFGVSIVLVGACLIGAALDLLLVSTAAWCIIGLFLVGSAYAAMKVRRSDWYSAVVGPPLAFAVGLMLVATFSPHDMGSGLMGTVATMLELLAYKARAVFSGTALALCIVLARRLPFRR